MTLADIAQRPIIEPDDFAPEDRDFIPPLENGDNLKADEFRRRYEAMPPNTRAELIGGIVYMSSPVNNRRHGKPHLVLSNWLGYYLLRTPGLEAGQDSTVRLEDDLELQPDLFLALPPTLGGGAHEDDDGYIVGVPELACEVAASSERVDLNQKLDEYRRKGVAEYLVWRTRGRRIDWFDLTGGRYVAKTPGADGLLKSTVFPGLWLDSDKLVALDRPGLFADVEAGAATAEHAAFLEKLSGAKST